MRDLLDALPTGLEPEEAIRSIVARNVQGFAAAFSARHIGEVSDPAGVINSKIHNVFLAELSEEVQYYSALSRSLDSSLGNMLEAMAIQIAQIFYEVKREVVGPLSDEQTRGIATLLERYKRNVKKPAIADYAFLRQKPDLQGLEIKQHISDYYLRDKGTDDRYLIELKIGGDLDNKKARSEKEALLEQYAILSNTLPEGTNIRILFATAYNRFGEGRPWLQGRVRQFFAQDELLISRDFWNFVCHLPYGHDIVMSEYRKYAPHIRQALETVRRVYTRNKNG